MRRPRLTQNGRSEGIGKHGKNQKSKAEKELSSRHRKKSKTVHCATPMDLCHLKNCGLDKKFQTYKCYVVQRGDVVKDDSGSYVVFTEQGSSASHMTAATVLYVISRLPRMRRTSK